MPCYGNNHHDIIIWVRQTHRQWFVMLSSSCDLDWHCYSDHTVMLWWHYVIVIAIIILWVRHTIGMLYLVSSIRTVTHRQIHRHAIMLWVRPPNRHATSSCESLKLWLRLTLLVFNKDTSSCYHLVLWSRITSCVASKKVALSALGRNGMFNVDKNIDKRNKQWFGSETRHNAMKIDSRVDCVAHRHAIIIMWVLHTNRQWFVMLSSSWHMANKKLRNFAPTT